MDTEIFGQLADVLTRQCSVLRELAAVAEGQKQALLERDQAGVEAATKEQEALLAELSICEAERIQLLTDGSLPGREPAEAVTLQEIIDSAPAAYRQTLAALRDEARTLVQQLSALTETNTQLLKQELALIDLYMSILSPDAGVDVYQDPARGKRPAGSSSVAFDARA